MELVLSSKDAALYGRLYASQSDISYARFCAGHLLKKGWHSQPWGRQGTIYQQQAAFTSAMITAYGRPFTPSNGWPKFPDELKDFDTSEQDLHDRLIRLRHKVFAHSDSESYKIRPWQAKRFSTDIVSAPVLRVTAAEAQLFQRMAAKLVSAIDKRMKTLRVSVL